LDLTYNQISEIKGLKSLTNLRILRLAHNNITRIEGLDNLTQLEELDLNDNQISLIEGLENLNNLRILRIFHNQINSEVFNLLDPIAYVIRPLEFVRHCQEISKQHV
jgi:protein phosphatase 1 regulatory subunit 7